MTWFQKSTESGIDSSTPSQLNPTTAEGTAESTHSGAASPRQSQVGSERIDLTNRLQVQAHENNIACLALNQAGTLLATASTQGTLLRVFDPKTGTQLGEFRRGSTPTTICDLSFDNESKYLTCASDKGTIHIFKVGHLLQGG